MKSSFFQLRKGVLHLGLPLIVLLVSAVIIFVVLKLNEKSEALDYPIGQIHADETVIYGWGTDIQDATITFVSSSVQGANGAQVDRVRYYLINPDLTMNHVWGEADWCSNYIYNDPTSDGSSECDYNSTFTYLIGDSSNPNNNYALNWNSASYQPESAQNPRFLTTANLTSGNYTVAIRVEDVNGQVTGNASTITITLSESSTPPPVFPSPTPGVTPVPTPVPTPSPPVDIGLEFSDTSLNFTMAQGASVKAFDMTSTGATSYSFYAPTSSLGIILTPTSGSIAPGSTIPINIQVSPGQPPGTYFGQVYIDHNNAQTPVGVYVNVHVQNLGLDFSVNSINLTLAPGETVNNVFNLTSTGATTFELYTPTSTLGIRFQPSNGNITFGSTIPIAIEASAGQAPGNYTGQVYASSSLTNAQTQVGITTDITLVNPAPVVEITSPGANEVLAGTVTANITATDNSGVVNVELYVDGVLAGQDFSAPYSISWDTNDNANGFRNLAAKATDTQGKVGESSPVQVIIDNAGTTGTVISTQLFSQGLIDEEIWEGDTIYGALTAKNEPQVMKGYHFWAKPVVSKMKTSDVFTNIVRFIATPVLTQIAYEAGTVENGSLVGNIILEGGKVFSSGIGVFVDQDVRYSTAAN